MLEPRDSSAADEQVGDTIDDALLRRLKRWYRKDREHAADWRKEAKEDFDFKANHQWSKEDERFLRENNRPVMTFGRIDPLVRSVVGEQINNAQEQRYIPREMGDVQVNEDISSVAKWIRDQCDAEDEESDAFEDLVTCGMGWIDNRLDFDADPAEPMPLIERIDPLEMLWDCDARKSNLTDRRRQWRVREMSLDDAKLMFPGMSSSDLDASWAALDTKEDEVRDQTEDDQYLDTGDNEENKDEDSKVTIVHVQWWDREPFYKVALPPHVVQALGQGEVIDLSVEEYGRLKGKLEALAAVPQADPMTGEPLPATPIQVVKLERKAFKQVFIGRKILKQGPTPCPTEFSFQCVTGFRDRNKGTWYGIVRAIKDPQRWANKWLSQILHIVNSTAKGGVMAEKSAAEDQREFEKTWARSEAVTWVEDGALANQRVQPKPGSQWPASIGQLMEYALSSIRDVAGINLEMLGMREADQPASLEYQRRQAGITILAVLFRSMKRYYKLSGRVLLYYIQNSLSPQTIVQVLGENGNPQYQPLQAVLGIKGASAKYDVIVDEGPTSPNQKERVWALIGPMWKDLPPHIQMVLIEYSPLPTSVIQKIKEANEQASQGPEAEMQQKMLQLEAMLTEAKVMLTQAQAGKAEADAAKTAGEIGQVQGDGGMAAQMEHEHRMHELAAQTETDRMRIMADAAAQRSKTEADFTLGQAKVMAERQNNLDWMRVEADTKRQSDMIGASAKLATAAIAAKAQQDKPQPKPDRRT